MITMASSVVSMPNPQDEGRFGRRNSPVSTALPSILGMYAFAAATFMVAARMAHWYGNSHSAVILFPLVLIFGGLAQFYAGAWGFRTNDAVALAMHGTWGSFWTAYGVLEILIATGMVVRPEGAFSALGYWFIVSAAITWAIMVASRKNTGITTVLALLAIGATLEAVAELAGLGWLRMVAGYLLIASAIAAWCVASALIIRVTKMEKTATTTTVAPSESVRVA